MQETGLPTRFGLAALATWRLAHLVAEEDGPADAAVHLRARAGDSWIGELMDCFYCLSVWTAAPFAFAVSGRRRETPVIWLALSGAACLLERATREKGAWDVLWEEAEDRRGRVAAGDARKPRRERDPSPAGSPPAATRR